jgi:hypothetical protein
MDDHQMYLIYNVDAKYCTIRWKQPQQPKEEKNADLTMMKPMKKRNDA